MTYVYNLNFDMCYPRGWAC